MQNAYPSRLARWVPRPLAALGLLLATAGAAQAQAPTFATAATYSSGGSLPYYLVLGDVNADGRLDIITVNFSTSSNTVGVLLGQAGGTFAAVTTYPTGGSGPIGVALGDVNADGQPDIIATNFNSNTVGVLLGQGGGTFASVVTYPTGGTGPLNVSLGDINADGRPDIVTTNFGSNTVGVLPGQAGGTFGSATTYSTGGSQPNGLTLGDVNADGRPDIVTTNYNSASLAVLIGQSGGTFASVVNYPSGGSQPNNIKLGDVNADGRPDIVTTNQLSNTVGVLLSQGGGTFAAAVTYPTGSSQPIGITLGDLNGDGQLDIAVAHLGSGSVGVLPGQAGGTFAAPAIFAAGGGSLRGVALGDVNADGRPDLVATNNDTGTLGVLLNTTIFGAPTLAVNPTSGPVGTSVTLTGTNLSGTTAVNFNGTPASSFVVNSATSITAVVAAGTTTGLVTVTTPGGTATSSTPFVVRVAPTTVADSYSTPQNVTLTGNVLTNDIGTNPRAILINRPTNGTLVLNPDGSFSYRPNAGFTGADSFTYYACDPGMPLLCGNPATVSITLLRIAPVTVADSYTTPAGVTLTGNVLTNDLGTNPRAILITRTSNGVLVLNPDGSFSYQPNAGFVGTDSFTYYACDPNLPLLCGNPATVTITVTRVAPITVADSYSTRQGMMLTGNVLTNDIGTNPRAILITRPTRGTLVLNPDGSFSYVPNASFVGTDNFTYYACNMGTPLTCGNPAPVSITVVAANPATRTAAAAPAATTTSAKPAATTGGGATISLELTLTGHPNPFGGQLQLSFTLPIAQAYTLTVYDAQGRLVQQLASGQAEAGQNQQLAVPTHTYAAGLYLVRLTTATGTQQLKLIKQ